MLLTEVVEVPTWASLAVIVSVLALSVSASLIPHEVGPAEMRG
jgi:hypothetical protein